MESVLGERVVTTSDIALEAQLSVRDPSVIPALFQGNANALEDQRRIRGHAGQVRLYQPSQRALEARLIALRRTFEAPGEWEAFLLEWGLTEETIQVLVRNRMVVEAAVLRTLGAPVEGEEQAWLARYQGWVTGLRAEGLVHRPEPLP